MKQESLQSSFYLRKILKTVNSINYLKPKIKPLRIRIKSKGGRSSGRIIVPRRGDFNKKIYRFVDFKRIICPDYKGLVLDHTYDPLRSANISLICFPNGMFCYILQPSKLNIGSYIINSSTSPLNYGDSAILANFPSGVLIHNIQGKFTRSAGSSAILIRKDSDRVLVKLRSRELRFFPTSVLASLGSIGNENHSLRNYRLAGTSRHLGRRPRTRPAAMNPVDHPLGGRTRGGKQPKNKKGRITLNRPTVKRYRSHILYTKRQLKLLRL